jgi:hypothetical protein
MNDLLTEDAWALFISLYQIRQEKKRNPTLIIGSNGHLRKLKFIFVIFFTSSIMFFATSYPKIANEIEYSGSQADINPGDIIPDEVENDWDAEHGSVPPLSYCDDEDWYNLGDLPSPIVPSDSDNYIVKIDYSGAWSGSIDGSKISGTGPQNIVKHFNSWPVNVRVTKDDFNSGVLTVGVWKDNRLIKQDSSSTIHGSLAMSAM